MRRIVVFTCLLSSLFAIGCTKSSSDDEGENPAVVADVCDAVSPRIISGKPCSASNSSAVRIVILQRAQTAYCSGSVVGARAVLTAAHCFFQPASSVFIELGNKELIEAERVIVHPEVSIDSVTKEVTNDAALLTFSDSLDLPKLSLLQSRGTEKGDPISIFGYGFDENGVLGTLRGGTMTVDGVDSRHVIASFDGTGSNTCAGDSGGPAILSVTQNGRMISGIVGITSSGIIENCGAGDVSLFTNTQSAVVSNFVAANVPDAEFN